MKYLTLGVLTALLLTATACNTIEGVGRDLKSAGSAIERKAGD